MWARSLQWPLGVCMSVMCGHRRPSCLCWLVGGIAALHHEVLLWFIPARLFETEIESQMWLVDQPNGYSPFVLKEPGGLTARIKAVCETSLCGNLNLQLGQNLRVHAVSQTPEVFEGSERSLLGLFLMLEIIP